MLVENLQSDQAKQQNESSNQDSDYQRKQYQQEFRMQKKEKKYQETSFILGCLKNHFIFYNLSEQQLENIAKNMFYCSVPAEQYIFKEGDRAECFFIIQKGNMQTITKEKVKKQLRVGDGFGEVALLYKAPRSVSVRAVENCSLWGIDRDLFKKSVEAVIIKQYQQNRKFMQNIRFFACLTNQDKDSIIATLIIQRFAKDEIIVNQGDPASSFYIIKQGSCSVWKGNKEIKKLQKGEQFGEQALYYNTIRQVTIKAQQDTVCLVLGRETLAKVLGDRIFNVTFRNFIRWCFDRHHNFSKLPKDQIETIIDEMKINYYKSGNVVIKKTSENNNNQKIIIVIEGGLKKSKTSNPIINKSQFYGEDFLSSFQENKQKMIDDEIIMDSDGVLAEISAFNFKNIIGGPLDIILAKNQRVIMEKQNAQQMNRAKYFQKLEEFSLIRQLREGNFGPVLLVRHNNDKGIYVLKCYSKQKIEELFVEKYIIQEKNLLKDINSNFVIELYKTFRDSKNLYSLVEFVRGEQLYDVIRNIGLLSTDDSQFYVACIILILEQFYNLGIIHRDIKPQNFIVNMKGYPILANMGTAKLLPAKGKNFQQLKTNTIIGTPHYIAPEIIQGKGYNFTVDLYSLGICMYQFLCGCFPFGDNTEDPQKIYDQILNADLKYPKFLKDKKAKKLIDQFLCKTDPDQRLGSLGFNSLKSHPWFQSLDWEKLKEHEVRAPKFNRKLNVPETDKDLFRMVEMGKKKVEDFLNHQFGNRHSDELKSYDNW